MSVGQQRDKAKPDEPAKRTDTVKCYVQIMVPASGTVGMSKEIEDNRVFLNGGILLYTKAYAISDSPGHYIKFLAPKMKGLDNIWMPDDKPVIMKYNW
jgi:hypothetical protein